MWLGWEDRVWWVGGVVVGLGWGWGCAGLGVAEGEAEGVDIHCKCHLRKWIFWQEA